MANTTSTEQHHTPKVGEPVEVWCSFDHAWHHGFRVHGIDESDSAVAVVLARADGTLLPTPVPTARVRSQD